MIQIFSPLIRAIAARSGAPREKVDRALFVVSIGLSVAVIAAILFLVLQW